MLTESIGNICVYCFHDTGGFDVCPNCGRNHLNLTAEPYHLHPKTVLADRYILGAVIDYGGFGIMYKAFDTKLEIIVAIKEFYPSGLVSRMPNQNEIIVFSGEKEKQFQEGKTRFLAECRNMANFASHPYIVRVYNYFEANKTAYIVMEYLDGISLKSYLKYKGGKITWKETLSVCEPIMIALEDMHNKGILHRDISPDNIFITRDKRIKLIDFGAARLSKGEDEQTLSVVVKIGYAPPEQYRTKSKQGSWTDVYALGAVMYQCITGIMPDESIDRVKKDKLKKPHVLGIEIPKNAEKALMKALALKEDFRFSKMHFFRLAIHDQLKSEYPEIEYKKRIRNKNIVIGIAIFTCFAAAVTLFLYQSYISPKIKPSDISIWIPAENREDNDFRMFSEIAGQFVSENPGFSVSIIPIPAEEYSDRILEAAKENRLPDLFRSDLVEENMDAYSIQLDYLLRTIDVDQYYFLSEYASYFPEKKKIPLSFSLPMIYINQNLLSDFKIDVQPEYEDIGSLLPNIDKKEDIYPLMIMPDVLATTIGSLGGTWTNDNGLLMPDENAEKILSRFQENDYISENALDMFLDEKLLFLIAESSALYPVQEDLSGYYQTSNFTKPAYASYSDIWSVGKQDARNEELGGMLLLNFFLSEYAQNIFYVQNDGNIPLCRDVYLSENILLNDENLPDHEKKITLRGFGTIYEDLLFEQDYLQALRFFPDNCKIQLKEE